MKKALLSDKIIELLGRHRRNDVLVEVTDLGYQKNHHCPSSFRIHAVKYDPEADNIVIEAHWKY
jgi:hypothetical protein